MKKGRPAKPRRRFWRIARRLFRWCRIVVWLGVLALLILLLWLHNYGLPDFVKQRLVFELRARGVELRFTRMRLVMKSRFMSSMHTHESPSYQSEQGDEIAT